MLWAGCWADGEPARVSPRREEGRIQSNVGNALPGPQSLTHNTLFYAYYFRLIMSVSWTGCLHKLQLQNISTSLLKTRILVEAAKSVRVLAEPHTNLTLPTGLSSPNHWSAKLHPLSAMSTLWFVFPLHSISEQSIHFI